MQEVVLITGSYIKMLETMSATPAGHGHLISYDIFMISHVKLLIFVYDPYRF